MAKAGESSTIAQSPHMTKKRSVWAQVKTGLRIASTLILGFLSFIALYISVSALTGQMNDYGLWIYQVAGGASLVLLSSILFATTRIWAKWLLGILAYCGVRLTFGVPAILIFGKMPQADLYSALVIIPLFLLSTVLVLRFVNVVARKLERVALVIFVDSLIFACVRQSWVPWLVGLVVLAISEALTFFLARNSSLRQDLASSK